MNILQQFSSLKEIHHPDFEKIGKKLYRGFINWQEEISLDSNWIKEHNFCDGNYRIVWVNIEEMGIFSFTEGDLCLEIFNDRAQFYKQLAKAAEFYQNH